MDFRLTDEQAAARETARAFAAREIAPHVEADERNHYFRRETLKKMADAGFFGCVIDERWGGNGAGRLVSVLITEQIAAAHASWGLPFNMQTTGPGLTIQRWGSDALKAKLLPGLVSADLIGCFAITEPDVGSDVAAIGTTARETTGGYIIDGHKTWITNAQIADVGIVFAVAEKGAGHKGMHAFVVDLKQPGVTSRPIQHKLGLHCSPTGELNFDGVFVPAENMLGAPGDGFKVCMTLLDETRLSCAARAAGVIGRCLELAVHYAETRRAFGKPVSEHQLVQQDLAAMHTDREAARMLVYKAAWEKDQYPGVRNTLSVSAAKAFAADAANRAADATLRIFGAYGFSGEYPIERIYRDAKSYQIVEGSHNIQKLIIASGVLAEARRGR